MSQLKEKFDWVKGQLNEWDVTREDQAILVGEGTACAIEKIANDPEKAKILEQRIDGVARIIQNLRRIEIIPPDPEFYARWLHSKIDIPPLSGKSPLEFIRTREDQITAIQEVARAMEGP